MKRVCKYLMIFLFSLILVGLETTTVYAATDTSLTDYYNVVEKINQKYDASIVIPREDELDIERILAMSLDEFEDLIEQQYLQVFSENIVIQSAGNNSEASDAIGVRSSGIKTQYCFIINSNGDKCGQFYLTANVVEAGVNQYTSIRKYGSEAVTTCGYWFETIKSSCVLSSDRKTCTVSYTGVFKNDLGLVLTSQTTYKVTYKVNEGNQYLLIGSSQEF